MARYCVIGYFRDRKYKVEGRSEYDAYDNLQDHPDYIGSNEADGEILDYVNEEDVSEDGLIDEEDDKLKIYEFDCIKWPNGCLVEAESAEAAKAAAKDIFKENESVPDETEVFEVDADDERFKDTGFGYHSYFSEKYGLHDYF